MQALEMGSGPFGQRIWDLSFPEFGLKECVCEGADTGSGRDIPSPSLTPHLVGVVDAEGPWWGSVKQECRAGLPLTQVWVLFLVWRSPGLRS